MEHKRNSQMIQTSPQHYDFDADEVVSNMFSSFSISSAEKLNCRAYLPETLAGEFCGVGTPIGVGEGSVRPFCNSSGRVYSGVGHPSPLTVDPHYHQYHPYSHLDVGSSGFDQHFDFDQESNLIHKEQLYCKSSYLNPYLYSNAAILDETCIAKSINSSNCSRFGNHSSVNDMVASSKLRNQQAVSILSLKELRGRICSLAKDQNSCRLLQAKFENPTNDEIEIVFYEVLDSISDLMKDQFGNYLIQKLIAVCNDDHKLRILLSLADNPVEIILVCMSPHGTRAMQKLLENLTDPYQIGLAMAALCPGAARLATDPNGHHVIQYCLTRFPSNVNEPILSEIAEKCYEVATDRSGCCVLQACMAHSHGEVRDRIVAEILSNAIPLAEDPFGNYVLQHMVGLNVPKFTSQLVKQLQGNFAYLSCNKYASNVVERCLNESGEKISSLIIMELITSPNPSMLLIDPYANFVIQSALTVSTGFVYDSLLELISDNMSSIRSNLYGKKILAWFEKRKILGI